MTIVAFVQERNARAKQFGDVTKENPMSTLRPQPFHVAVSQDDLDDLRYRLQHARQPYSPAGAGWSRGTDAASWRVRTLARAVRLAEARNSAECAPQFIQT
jgi:hypothetical protein